MSNQPKDMPPIKEQNERTEIPQVKEAQQHWLLVMVLSIVALVLTPILSNFWVLMIFPIGLSITALVLAIKEFKVIKHWIIALVLAIMAVVNVGLTVENVFINFVSQMTMYNYSYNYRYDTYYDHYDYDDWYWN